MDEWADEWMSQIGDWGIDQMSIFMFRLHFSRFNKSLCEFFSFSLRWGIFGKEKWHWAGSKNMKIYKKKNSLSLSCRA